MYWLGVVGASAGYEQKWQYAVQFHMAKLQITSEIRKNGVEVLADMRFWEADRKKEATGSAHLHWHGLQRQHQLDFNRIAEIPQRALSLLRYESAAR